MKHLNSEGFGHPAPALVSPQSMLLGINAVLLLHGLASSRMFTRVSSEC